MSKFDEFIQILKEVYADEVFFYIKKDTGTRFDSCLIWVDIENFLYIFPNDVTENPVIKCYNLESYSDTDLNCKFFTDEELEVFCNSAIKNTVKIKYQLPGNIYIESYIEEDTIDIIFDTYQKMAEGSKNKNYHNEHAMDLAVVSYDDKFHCALDILWKKNDESDVFSLTLELFVIDESGHILETKELNLKDIMKDGELERIMKELLIDTIKSI